MVNSMVERATSDMLIGPDWAMNIEISDMLNQDPGQAKDIVKGIKRRIGSKNPKVQLLALTLLETIIKNCGDIVHMHVAEKNVLQEMVKIVKKKPDYQVKEKILILIDTWQEAFGGPRARYPQYYAAYQELLRAGAVFPPRSERSAPVFTPPQSHPLSSYSENVRNSAFNHDVDRAESSAEAEYPTLSMSEIQNARGSMDVLSEMLNAIDPGNKEGLRQEALADLVEQCRTYKQRVVHLVNSTADESLLCQGLALNDDLQRVLAKYESILSGTNVQAEISKPEPKPRDLVDVDSSRQPVDAGESSKQANERSTSEANTSDLLSLSAPSVANGTAAVSKADPKMDLLSGDLLGGDDYSSPMQNTLALVPVSAPQRSSPLASDQNALALVDMFSAGSSVQNPLNGPPALSSGSEFQHQQHLHPQQLLYQNGMPTNMGSPYDQAGHPQASSPSWGAQNVHLQQQPSSPAYAGAQNGGSSLPPPPWELQPMDSQTFGAPNSPTLQASTLSTPHPPQMQPPTLPTAGTEQVAGMYVQPTTGSQLPAINQPFQMPMYPQPMQGPQMMGMMPQPMQATQMTSMYHPMYANQMGGYANPMAGYGNPMAGYGYAGYGQQQDAQFLEQRMYGLSVKDDMALRSGASSQTSMAYYLPQMKQQPKGDDKLFGDLVNMAKMKPTKTPPGRSGSM